MKKLVIVLLSLTMVIGMNLPSFATEVSDDISVYVNGNPVIFDDVKPMISNDGRTLIPIRKVTEATFASVAWGSKEKAVYVFRDGKSYKMTIGSSDIVVQNFECKKEYKYTSFPITKKIDPENADIVPVIISGRTMVPLRGICEAMGAKLDWNEEERRIDITIVEYKATYSDRIAADNIANYSFYPDDYVIEITDVFLEVKNGNTFKRDKDGEKCYDVPIRGLQLDYSVLPTTAEKQEVEYLSSNPSVATVDKNGLVTRGVSKGVANITVEVSGVVSKPIRVKVK